MYDNENYSLWLDFFLFLSRIIILRFWSCAQFIILNFSKLRGTRYFEIWPAARLFMHPYPQCACTGPLHAYQHTVSYMRHTSWLSWTNTYQWRWIWKFIACRSTSAPFARIWPSAVCSSWCISLDLPFGIRSIWRTLKGVNADHMLSDIRIIRPKKPMLWP